VAEPWPGTYHNPNLSAADRSNYALREEVLTLVEKTRNGPTAVITHGANPGMVSHFVKKAFLNIARSWNMDVRVPTTRSEWAQLGQRLGIQTIHISERDFQWTETQRQPGEFLNTWSVDGFISEGCQPAELGWGTHEKMLPPEGATHVSGCKSAIYLNRPGSSVRVKSWTPKGPHIGYLITHHEAISISDYFTARDSDGEVTWRPTVFYAYRPFDECVLSIEELTANNFDPDVFTKKQVLVDEIVDGRDELGVLLMGIKPAQSGEAQKPFAYWFGSELECSVARGLVEHNQATSLQVTSSILSAVMWAMRNPNRGVVEPEELPHEEILQVMYPYISPVVGTFTEWNTLSGRGALFPEDVDPSDPWQFKNMRVV